MLHRLDEQQLKALANAAIDAYNAAQDPEQAPNIQAQLYFMLKSTAASLLVQTDFLKWEYSR